MTTVHSTADAKVEMFDWAFWCGRLSTCLFHVLEGGCRDETARRTLEEYQREREEWDAKVFGMEKV